MRLLLFTLGVCVCGPPTVVHAGKTFPLSPQSLPVLAPVLQRLEQQCEV